MPLDQDTSNAQLTLLAAHRRTLAHLLTQQAQYSAGNIPAHIATGIVEARADITRIKTYLRQNGGSIGNQGQSEPILDLRRADLQGDILSYVNLQGANLQGANLQGADLEGAKLQRANLQGADLRRAVLEGTDMQGANLQGANLDGAN